MISTAFNLCTHCGSDSVHPIDVRELHDHAHMIVRCPNCERRRGVIATTAEAEWYLGEMSDQVDQLVTLHDRMACPSTWARFDDYRAAWEVR